MALLGPKALIIPILSFIMQIEARFVIHIDGYATIATADDVAGMITTGGDPDNPTILLVKLSSCPTIKTTMGR